MSAIGAGPSPDHLLTQIRSLLGQYLAMGSDTPVAPEAQQLADAIDQIVGGGDQLGGAPGGPPPPAGGPADALSAAVGGGGGGGGIPDMTGGLPLNQQQSGGFKDFKSASSAAKGDMNKKKKGTKGK